MITVNMNKAREIKRELIRTERKALLEALDVAFMRAVEQGDTVKQQEIAVEKQRLRDATEHPDIEAAQTPEALKAVNPIYK